jgi:hypothetical protein
MANRAHAPMKIKSYEIRAKSLEGRGFHGSENASNG